ncbi:hypothetical protein ROHU_034388 [Labeo rohita]|uniref:Uncharacterized protein n=1 Tax=Labeo rohita TaxID=84645 RepID=A0A498L8C0_LABRO|nr:hypothetical protein ROHU_034388 [Labeo rohita]
MFGNSLVDAKFLIINPGHYKAFSTVIDPTVPIPPADAASLSRERGRVGVAWVIGYRGRRMEIKPLAVCQQQPEGDGQVVLPD